MANEKLKDILLFGPQNAGKTQLYKTLRREIYSDPQQTDYEKGLVVKKGLLRWRSHKITLQEIGGKDIFLRSEKKLREAFTKNKKLVFVFNGNELIEESQQYQQGGYISCLLKCYVLPLLEENGSNRESDLFFIATHKDNYKNIEKDMAAAIMSGLSHANEEYRKVANAFRYPFISLMRGNLFCVDARDYEQVNNVFQQIKQTIKK